MEILAHGAGHAPARNVCRVHHDLFHRPPDRRPGRRRGASVPRARPGCEGAGGGAGDSRRGPGRTGGPGVGASRRGGPGYIGPGPGFPVVHGGLRDRPAAVRPPGAEPRRPGFRSLRGAGSPVRLRAPAGRRGQGWPAGGNHVDGDVARGPGAHSQGCGPDPDVLRPPDHGRRFGSGARSACPAVSVFLGFLDEPVGGAGSARGVHRLYRGNCGGDPADQELGSVATR